MLYAEIEGIFASDILKVPVSQMSGVLYTEACGNRIRRWRGEVHEDKEGTGGCTVDRYDTVRQQAGDGCTGE